MKLQSQSIRNRQGGLSLLEVLIALAVLSIGLAGLAIMHMNSLQYVHSAYYRSVASAIALDLEERLWLRLAEADAVVPDCPDLSSDGAAYASLLADWRDRSAFAADGWPGFGSSNLATIRNVRVIVGEPSGSTFTEVPVTIGWDETRFNPEDDDRNLPWDEYSDADTPEETYLYNVRLLCKLSTTGSVSS
jgi:type IV pilus assembly protein PilV